MRAEASRHEQQLAAEIARREHAYRGAELASYRDYLAALAKAYGYDEETARRAAEWLGYMPRDGSFRVASDRIEIQIHGGITAIFRKSSGFDCEHYFPEEDSKRCISYRGSGECARPEYSRCVEWLKRNN